MVYTLEELRKIQLLELKIAKEIKRICVKNNITYFLIGGTLLGAVRHNGFIPWDDDMDIGMVREEYEKFLNVCKTDLNKDFFLQTVDTDSKYGLFFAKIRLKGTKFIEDSARNATENNGIYVDIFPFDYFNNNKFFLKLNIVKTNFMCNLYRVKCGYEMWKKDVPHLIYYYILRILSKFFNKEYIKLNLKKIYGKCQFSERLIDYFDCYPNKEYVNLSWINNPAEISFENEKFSCPINYKQYLIDMYGDYMKLPPEDQRYNRHNISDLSFGKYKNDL